jgi:hypothetical protein
MASTPSNSERIGPHTIGEEAFNAVGWQDKARYPVMRLSAPQIQSMASNLLEHHKGSSYNQNNQAHAALLRIVLSKRVLGWRNE